jgi:phage protein D
VQHSLTDSAGYTMSLELESKLPEDSVDGLYEESKGGAYTGVVAFYKDPVTGQEKSVKVGDMSRPKRISRVFDSEKSAKQAAEREWKRIQEQKA